VRKFVATIIFLVIGTNFLFGQQDRFRNLEERLRILALEQPGLNEIVNLSVSDATIQEFLGGLATSGKLNINVDAQLNIKVHNNFASEKIVNILMFLIKEYDLDVRITGTILSFFKYQPIKEKVKIIPKEIRIQYDSVGNKLSMDLKYDSLLSVAKRLTQISDHNVLTSPGLSDKLVSVYLEDLPFEVALEKLCYSNDLELVRTTDNVFLIRKVDEASLSKKANGVKNQKQKLNNEKRDDFSEDIIVSSKDSLGHRYINMEAQNLPLSYVIQIACEHERIDYFLYSKVDGNTTVKARNVSFDQLLSHLFKGTNYTYRLDQNIYLIGDRTVEGLRVNKVFQFQYRSTETMIDLIPGDLKKGVEIKEFKELNSILLIGAQPQISEIESLFRNLDKVVPLIYMEVIMLDVEKSKSISTGITVGTDSLGLLSKGLIFPGIDFTIGTTSINKFIDFLGINNAVNIGHVGPKFYAKISALEENGNVNVHSIPKLSTLNGHEATLSIGSTRYYSQSTQTTTGSVTSNVIVTQQYHAVNADMAITFRPMVSGDNQVTMNIEIKISDFIGTPPANAPPPTSTSAFKSILRVRDGETIALGGIERTEQSDRGSGVPILSRIPILKLLFSSRIRSTKKVTSIVFIKPTIIY
jgi:type IV pilus assembly protein PilQ